jgi:predicted N-acetyltransferase YhbS
VLEFLGVDQDYQEKGLGSTLVGWGCQQADAAGLEVYLDATIKGLPFYRNRFGFQDRKMLEIPVRPGSFGTYELTAVVRPARALYPAKTRQVKHTVVTEVVELVDEVEM